MLCAQFLNQLPRRDRKFVDVSSNMADYKFVNCSGDPGHRSCKLATPEFGDLQNGKDANSPYYEVCAAIVRQRMRFESRPRLECAEQLACVIFPNISYKSSLNVIF